MPASFRTAESPEVLFCTPDAHQSEQPKTGFKAALGTAVVLLVIHELLSRSAASYLGNCLLGHEREPSVRNPSVYIDDSGLILPLCPPLARNEVIVVKILQPV